MKVEYNEETSVRKSLTFEIEPEIVDKEVEKRARDYARKVRIPGFRPGKVPPDVIKKRFRAQVLEDAAEAIVNRVVFEELEGRGLRPLASPKVTDLKIDESQPMTFRAEIGLVHEFRFAPALGYRLKQQHGGILRANAKRLTKASYQSSNKTHGLS